MQALRVKSSLFVAEACTLGVPDISENAREHVLHGLYPPQTPSLPHLPLQGETLKSPQPQQLIFAACSCSKPISSFSHTVWFRLHQGYSTHGLGVSWFQLLPFFCGPRISVIFLTSLCTAINHSHHLNTFLVESK